MFSGYRVLGSDISGILSGMMPSIFMFSQHLHLFVFEVMFYVKPCIFRMTDDASFHSWRQHVLHLYHCVPVWRPGHLCRCCTGITDGGCMVSSQSPILLLFWTLINGTTALCFEC